jgi:isopropylmalate/homocitrate/citramalate synthase
MMHAIVNEGGLPSEWLEFHGHNDFHLAVAISTSAWLYGCCGNNGTLLGIGERAGNTPTDGLLFQLLQMKPNISVDTTVVKEISDYYCEIGYKVPEFYPLVGSNFNVTRAGVHADGMVKNPEIYTPYDFESILGRAPKSVVGQYSGTSGIAWKVNDLLNLERGEWLRKDNPGVILILEEVTNQYNSGRVTAFSDREIERMMERYLPEEWERNGNSSS